jgi:hypothetical protein
MSPEIIRRALEHYSALHDEMRRQEAADAVERLQRVAAFNAQLEQAQIADKLRRYGMVVR